MKPAPETDWRIIYSSITLLTVSAEKGHVNSVQGRNTNSDSIKSDCRSHQWLGIWPFDNGHLLSSMQLDFPWTPAEQQVMPTLSQKHLCVPQLSVWWGFGYPEFVKSFSNSPKMILSLLTPSLLPVPLLFLKPLFLICIFACNSPQWHYLPYILLVSRC